MTEHVSASLFFPKCVICGATISTDAYKLNDDEFICKEIFQRFDIDYEDEIKEYLSSHKQTQLTCDCCKDVIEFQDNQDFEIYASSELKDKNKRTNPNVKIKIVCPECIKQFSADQIREFAEDSENTAYYNYLDDSDEFDISDLNISNDYSYSRSNNIPKAV